MSHARSLTELWKQNLRAATGFWGLCLLLVVVEAQFGENLLSAAVFFVSVPLLVAYLTWINRALLLSMGRGGFQVVVLGVHVLCLASAILFIGLFAAANLKSLIVGV